MFILCVFMLLGGCHENPYEVDNIFGCPRPTTCKQVVKFGAKPLKEDVVIYGKSIDESTRVLYQIDDIEMEVLYYGFEKRISNINEFIDSLNSIYSIEFIQDSYQYSQFSVSDSSGCSFDCSYLISTNRVNCWYSY